MSKDAKRVEGYSRGKPRACERAFPRTMARLKQALSCLWKAKKPVWTIQFSISSWGFSLSREDFFSSPQTLRNTSVFASGLFSTIYITQIKPLMSVLPDGVWEDTSHCYFLHRPLKKSENFINHHDSYPLWGQNSLENGKKVINHLPIKCTKFCIKFQGLLEPSPFPSPLIHSR